MALKVRVQPGDNRTLVQVDGDLDVFAEESLQQILLEVMRVHSPRLLLDLGAVSFIDCAGLRALLRTRRRAEMRKGSMRIVAASASVRRIIRLTALKDVLPVSGTGHPALSTGEGHRDG